MGNFRKLRVWEAARVLAVNAHRVSLHMHTGPKATLRDQLVRAALSVPANIVEGSAHESPKQFARFVQYALASVSEFDGHIQLARDLRMISESDFATLSAQVVDVRMMLHGLLKTLKNR